MKRLEKKAAFITGAGSGIGRAIAELFASEGACVAVADWAPEAGRETVARIADAGGTAMFVETDVTQETSMQHSIKATVEAFGGLHVLCNNAGGSTIADGLVTEAPVEEFWRAIRVDLFGTWLGCRFGIPELAKAGGGSVINIVSVSALMGVPRLDAYTAAKGGVVALTRSMAVEFASSKVRVNAIAPGRTMTDRVRLQLIAKPGRGLDKGLALLGDALPIEIAYLAVYLASDESRVTTGQIVAVDSGITVS